jgi:hypothetical protein
VTKALSGTTLADLVEFADGHGSGRKKQKAAVAGAA